MSTAQLHTSCGKVYRGKIISGSRDGKKKMILTFEIEEEIKAARK